METAEALPALVRWLLAGLSSIQMALMTWPHENDVRRTLDVLFERRFTPIWLTRMREAGAPLPWIHAAEGLAAAALGLVLLEIFLLLLKYRRKLTPQRN
jgi:hypothetical protein